MLARLQVLVGQAGMALSDAEFDQTFAYALQLDADILAASQQRKQGRGPSAQQGAGGRAAGGAADCVSLEAFMRARRRLMAAACGL